MLRGARACPGHKAHESGFGILTQTMWLGSEALLPRWEGPLQPGGSFSRLSSMEIRRLTVSPCPPSVSCWPVSPQSLVVFSLSFVVFSLSLCVLSLSLSIPSVSVFLPLLCRCPSLFLPFLCLSVFLSIFSVSLTLLPVSVLGPNSEAVEWNRAAGLVAEPGLVTTRHIAGAQ